MFERLFGKAEVRPAPRLPRRLAPHQPPAGPQGGTAAGALTPFLGASRTLPLRTPQGMPVFKTGSVDAVPAVPAGPPGSGVAARHLLPEGDEWDFDVIVTDVPPGRAAGGVVKGACEAGGGGGLRGHHARG